MNNLIKNKTHQKILIIVIIITGLIIINHLPAIANGGNFIITNILGDTSVDTHPTSKKEATIVKTKKISLDNITQSISASAVTKPSNKTKISSKTTGKIVSVYFKEGDWINVDQTIIQLEQDQILKTTYNNAQNNLINTSTSMEQDIKTTEIAVESAKVTLMNAEKSLNNTNANNKQSINDAYTNALNTSRNTILTGVNALISLTDIQYKYMNSGGQSDIRIADKKAIAICALLGQKNAGRYVSQSIGSMNGGVKKQIEETINNPTHKKIDQILIDITPAMQKVRNALSELRPIMDKKQTTTAEKTMIDIERANVESALTILSTTEQAITNAKLNRTTDNDASQFAYDNAKKQLELVEANLASIKKKAKLQIDIAQGQLNFAQAQLDDTTITTPISGIVSQKYIEIGETIIAGNPIAEIVNINNIEIELFLTEFDIGKIFIGQNAKIKLSAYPDEEFIGKVYFVSPIADSINKKFPIKIQLKNDNQKIRAGIIANIEIIL